MRTRPSTASNRITVPRVSSPSSSGSSKETSPCGTRRKIPGEYSTWRGFISFVSARRSSNLEEHELFAFETDHPIDRCLDTSLDHLGVVVRYPAQHFLAHREAASKHYQIAQVIADVPLVETRRIDEDTAVVAYVRL